MIKKIIPFTSHAIAKVVSSVRSDLPLTTTRLCHSTTFWSDFPAKCMENENEKKPRTLGKLIFSFCGKWKHKTIMFR